MAVYDYRISNGSTSVIAGTGSIEVATNTTALVGTGTAFTTQLHVGDIIKVGTTIIGTIASITDVDDAVLTYPYAPGLAITAYSIDPMVNLETLSTPASPPKGDYQPWSVSMPTGDALARGLGRALAQWRWNMGPADFLPIALRNALRTYCTGKSARVYIRTRTFEKVGSTVDAFATFQAAMIWPDKEDRDWKGLRKGFIIELRDLIPL